MFSERQEEYVYQRSTEMGKVTVKVSRRIDGNDGFADTRGRTERERQSERENATLNNSGCILAMCPE